MCLRRKTVNQLNLTKFLLIYHSYIVCFVKFSKPSLLLHLDGAEMPPHVQIVLMSAYYYSGCLRIFM